MGDGVAGKQARFQSADGDFTMAASGGTISDYPARVIAAQWNLALRKAAHTVTINGAKIRGFWSRVLIFRKSIST